MPLAFQSCAVAARLHKTPCSFYAASRVEGSGSRAKCQGLRSMTWYPDNPIKVPCRYMGPLWKMAVCRTAAG